MNFPPPLDRLKTIFRSLLIAEIALTAIVTVLSSGYGWIPAASAPEVATADPTTAEIVGILLGFAFLIFLFVVVLSATIAAWIGLFQFRPWARWLYLGIQVATAFIVIVYGFFSFSQVWEWGLLTELGSLLSVLSGGILALMFFSELAREFAVPVAATVAATPE